MELKISEYHQKRYEVMKEKRKNAILDLLTRNEALCFLKIKEALVSNDYYTEQAINELIDEGLIYQNKKEDYKLKKY
ncbi:MAG: hypothetical protein ACP5D2_02435 [Candidatus Nanoarchaeia archaeon]